MRKHGSNAIMFLAGVLACLALVVTWFGWLMEPATAQGRAKEAATSRFEVSSWATPNSERGAYVVDSQTGDVFFIVETEKPQYLGRAEKK